MTALDDTAATVCIANIGLGGRRRRMRFGTVLLGIGAGLTAVLVGFDVHRPWRLVLFLPFWIGASGVFQAREKT